MMSGVIRPLAEILTELPARAGGSDELAGPSFEIFTGLRLPVHQVNAWQILYERLLDAAGECADVAADTRAPQRLEFVAENVLLLGEAVKRIAPGRWG
jgi:hypothetical protein